MSLFAPCFIAGALSLLGAPVARAQGGEGGTVAGQVTDAGTKQGIANAAV